MKTTEALCIVLALLAVMLVPAITTSLYSEGPDPTDAGDRLPAGIGFRFNEPRDPVILGNLAMFRELSRLRAITVAGVLTPTGELTYIDTSSSWVTYEDHGRVWATTPDGIEWANLFTKQEGRAWRVMDGVSPDGATDSDDECDTEVGSMCADAGHGGASGGGTRTQHLQEDGGGCTCSGDCDENGAVAFITSSSACG